MPRNSGISPEVIKQASEVIALGKGLIKYRDRDEDVVLDMLDAGNVEYELYSYGSVRYASVKHKIEQYYPGG